MENTTTATVAPEKSRREKKKQGRQKRVARLQSDKVFAKAYFELKSKKALEKKASFKKKKNRKK